MQQPCSIVEELEAAYAIIAQALAQAPQLHDCHLDQALLVLALSIKRARRSRKLNSRPPCRDQYPPYPPF